MDNSENNELNKKPEVKASPDAAVQPASEAKPAVLPEHAPSSEASAETAPDVSAAVSVKKKRRKIFAIILVVLLALAAIGGICAWQITSMKYSATAAVYDAKNLIRAFVALDADEADERLECLKADASGLQEKLENPFWNTVGFVFRRDVDSARVLASSLDRAADELFTPASELLRTDPPKSAASAEIWLGLCDELMPSLAGLSDDLEAVNFRFYDSDGRIQGYIDILQYFTLVLQPADEDFIKPAVRLLAEYPLSEIKTGDGWNFTVLGLYMDFLADSAPKLAETIKGISPQELSKIDPYGKVSALCTQMSSLAGLASGLATDVVAPVADLLQEQPLSELTVEGGFNAALIRSYAELLEKILPRARELTQEFYSLDLSSIDKDGKMTALVDKINALLVKYEPAEEYLPLLQVLMGSGEDRTYIFPVQNSSEIRASGGFPGSVGLITVRDGVLSFGNFAGVHSSFSMYCSARYNITEEEKDIFSQNIILTWDACYCPDYERVGQIYSYAAEDKLGIPIDGSISMTPSVLQDVLKLFGEITAFNGMTLNGDNATRVIQRDIYFWYYPYDSDNNLYAADSFFGDCAKKAVELVKSGLNKDSILDLVEVFRAGCEDRRIMLWMADEEEEAIVKAAGCSGGLNHDSDSPEAGIYISGFNACKLGWWLGATPVISGPVVNPDGSRTYDITVTMQNTLTWDDYCQVSVDFVTAGEGVYDMYTLFFAPEGGTISDFTCSRGDISTREYTYEGLQCVRATYYLAGGTSFVFSYKITTAPGVETPLGISMTPTLQEYW